MTRLTNYFLFALLISAVLACSAPKKDEPAREKSFQFVPKEPVDGKYLGIVELGGDGFNSFIINADTSNLWFLEKAEYGVSNAYDDSASLEEIQAGLQNYITKMLDYKVQGEDIHFVVSSTAVKNPKVQAIDSILGSLGYIVNTVDAEEEGKFALIATLPPSYYNKGFMVDIGSGNTKFSWREDDQIISKSTYGAKYYSKNTDDQTVIKSVNEILSMIPAARKKHCFIIGGVPYKLAKDLRKNEERYTMLDSPDKYSKGDDQKFIGGLTIYEAIHSDDETEVVIFDWEANFSIGFLLDIYNSPKEDQSVSD